MIPVNAGEGRGRPKPDVVDRPRPTVISVLDRERNGGSFCGAEASLLTLLFSPTVVSLGWETLFPGIAAVRPGAAGEAGRKLSFVQMGQSLSRLRDAKEGCRQMQACIMTMTMRPSFRLSVRSYRLGATCTDRVIFGCHSAEALNSCKA